MHAFRVVGVFTLVSTLSLPSFAQVVPTEATRTMLDETPGLTALVQDQRVVAMYGVPCETNDGTNLDQFVADFVTNTGDGFGVDGVVLALKDKITIRNGGLTVYTYYQTIDGLPVDGSVLKIPVILDQVNQVADIIAYAGIRLTAVPNPSLPAGTVTAAQAVDTVANSPDFPDITNLPDPLDPNTPPDEVIFEAPDGTMHRVWRFDGWGDGGSFRFYVDTTTGDIVFAQSLLVEFGPTVSGTVKGLSTPCCDAAGTPTEVALPGVEVNVEFELVCPAGSFPPASPDGTTNASEAPNPGQYTFPNVDPLPARVTSLLRSRLVDVLDCSTPSSPNFFADALGCLADAEANTLPRLQECAAVPTGHIPSTSVDLTFNGIPDPLITSQINVFVAVHQTNDWFAQLQSNFDTIDQPISAIVNLRTSLSNANFSPAPLAILFWDGAENPINPAYSTIISHEYGHFTLNTLLDLATVDADFGEGIADIITSLVHDTPVIGSGFCGAGRFVRDVDEPDVPLVIDTGTDCADFPVRDNQGPWCFGLSCLSVHGRGLALAGAFWDLRTEITKTLVLGGMSQPDAEAQAEARVDRLFVDFLFITDGQLDESVLVEVLIADDDDGVLFDPATGDVATPNGPEIEAAFVELHRWSFPNCDKHGTVVVEWQGPNDPPVPGMDYAVQDNVCPPIVTLITTEKMEGQDIISVETWRVGRKDDNGDPDDLGQIVTTWPVGSDSDIEVRVGTTPTTPVKSVTVVNIPAQSTTNYSSIALRLGGRCEGEPGILCNDDAPCTNGVCVVGRLGGRARSEAVVATGVGGRIGGFVRGSAGVVSAQAIGSGAAGFGDLTILGDVSELTVDSIPADPNAQGQPESVLRVGGIGQPGFTINGALLGTLEVTGDLVGRCFANRFAVPCSTQMDCSSFFPCASVPLSILGAGDSTGDIVVTGKITAFSSITVTGSMSGNISATGDILGEITINDFTGDICAPNLFGFTPENVADEGNAENLAGINFGTGGTVCAAPQTPANAPGFAKNRYISFFIRSPAQLAIQVKDVLNNATWWVDLPTDVSELSGKDDATPPTFKAASHNPLCVPVYANWKAFGVVHVYHESIVPDGVYEITSTMDGEVLTAPLVVTNGKWGDAVGSLVNGMWTGPDGTVSVPSDVVAILDKFTNRSGAPLKSRADIEPSVPDLKINITDVTRALDAFSGAEYPFTSPPAEPPCQ